MTINLAAMAAEFHDLFNQKFGDGGSGSIASRKRLHEEEHRELIEAHARLIASFDENDIPAVAHELADNAILLYGSAHSLGIPLDLVIRHVHEANMAKVWLDGRVRLNPDGKVTKPPGFRRADIAGVLEVFRSTEGRE
jgi:predicted HAD superfamily Cof-like phosphohydrolase